MSKRTKKIGIAGRFGARYGSTIRQRIVDIEKIQKAKHRCPNCTKYGLKRPQAGIWECPKCGHKFAGKAYKPA